jgi:TolB-like protein
MLAVVALLLILPLMPGSAAPRPMRVAVLPFTVHSAEDLSYVRNGIWDIISTRIIVEGQIEVVEKPLVQRFIGDLGGEISDQQARWLGSRVGADYAVYGSITKVGEYISLDAKVVDVTGRRATTSAFAQHKGLDEVMNKVGTFAQDIANRILGQGTSYDHKGPGQARQNLQFQSLGYSKLMGFPKRILKGVDVGDIDGDGKNEVVVMGEHHLWVYRDVGKESKLVGEYDGANGDNYLTLDVIDITGDKKAEICVTNAYEDKLMSFILTWENGSFRVLAGQLGWYFRVVKVPGQGDRLLAQQLGSNTDYEGAIRPVEWNGKKIKIGKGLKQGKKGVFPNEAEWVLAINSGKFTSAEAQEFLVLTDMGQIRMLDAAGDLAWKSSDDYGGSDNFIDRPLTRYGFDKRGAAAITSRRIYLPPRMVVKDMDGDGIDDLVMVVNKFATGSFISKERFYDKGYVTGLSWDGMTMAGTWRTQDIPGYVADFQVKDVDNDGLDELVLVSVSAHMLSSEVKGLLMVFKLYE